MDNKYKSTIGEPVHITDNMWAEMILHDRTWTINCCTNSTVSTFVSVNTFEYIIYKTTNVFVTRHVVEKAIYVSLAIPFVLIDHTGSKIHYNKSDYYGHNLYQNYPIFTDKDMQSKVFEVLGRSI